MQLSALSLCEYNINYYSKMNDSDNFDLEKIVPSPVRGYNRLSLLLDKTKKRKRGYSSYVDAQTRAKMFQNSDFFAEKGQLFCRYCSVRMDHSRQSVLNAHLQSDTHKKHKSTSMEKKQVQGTLFTTLLVPNEARLDNITLITGLVRACAGSKISLNAASSSLFNWNPAQFFNPKTALESSKLVESSIFDQKNCYS